MDLRLKRLLGKLLLAVLAVFIALVSFASPALAIGDPDSISIESVKVYEGLWEAGDMLFVVEYKVMYTIDPDEDPGDTFLAGAWNGTIKGPDRPLDYYQHNFTSIYLSANQVASFGYVFEDTLSIRVMGNPSYFDNVTEGISVKTLVLSGQWVKGASIAVTREYLASWCIILAETFEASWPGPVDLLTVNGKLNSLGRIKFLEAIPGLDSICPEIFQVASTYPEYEDPTYTKTFETSLIGNVGARLTGVLDGLGQWITGKPAMGGLVGGIGLGILFFILAGRIFVATGSVPTSIAVSIPFLFVGNVIGILPLTITFVAAFLVVVLFAITFILGRVG